MYTRQALEIFNAAVNAVQPQVLLPGYLFIKEGNLYIDKHEFKPGQYSRLFVIAAGKAAPAMAKTAEGLLGQVIHKGICVTKYGHAISLQSFHTLEAAHPVPDANSILAGELVLQTLQELNADDIVLVLLSGGTSSLLADLVPGCTLEEIQELFTKLINIGADIREINTVRKHLSRIKGGQLANAVFPAKLFTFIISDVVGDDPGTIASGLTVPDDSTFEETYRILNRYGIWETAAKSIRQYISMGLKNEIEETPKSSSGVFSNTFTKVIGNNSLALESAKQKAEDLGYHSIIMTDKQTGDTELAARQFVNYLIGYNERIPACILMGGETTVKVTGNGKGGRNQHFALCGLNEWLENGTAGNNRELTLLAAGTDGTDGPTDAAGAVFNTSLMNKQLQNDGSAEEYLRRFDAYHYFSKYGGLVKTGPTQTNVMDIAIGLIN